MGTRRTPPRAALPPSSPGQQRELSRGSLAVRVLGPLSNSLPAHQHYRQKKIKLTYFILELYKCILFPQQEKASIWRTNPQIGCIASLNYL